jgi:hypothetical protein
MKMLLLAAIAASTALGAGAADADNPNVPPSSPYAAMEPGFVHPPARPAYGWRHIRAYRYGPSPYEGRIVIGEPNYVHDTAPPPGLMFDQPSTIGGYPLGY